MACKNDGCMHGNQIQIQFDIDRSLQKLKDFSIRLRSTSLEPNFLKPKNRGRMSREDVNGVDFAC